MTTNNVTHLKIGCDVVCLSRFGQTLTHGGPEFIERLFTAHEIAYAGRAEQLAGIFAIKESVIKAFGNAPQSWHDIEVYHVDGRPFVRCNPTQMNVVYVDVSVSHDGDYAFACAVLVLPEKNCIR